MLEQPYLRPHAKGLHRALNQVHTSSMVVRDVPGFRTTPALAPKSLICSAWQDAGAPQPTHDNDIALSTLDWSQLRRRQLPHSTKPEAPECLPINRIKSYSRCPQARQSMSTYIIDQAVQVDGGRLLCMHTDNVAADLDELIHPLLRLNNHTKMFKAVLRLLFSCSKAHCK